MGKKEINQTYGKFAKWANRIGKAGMVKCSSGNMSHRFDEETVLVSESGKWLANLKPDQIVKVSLTEGTTIEGNKPTGELPLHLAVLQRNNRINTVLHCQMPAATTLACRISSEINYNVIIEVPIYIGEVKHLPFIMPGSYELGDAVGNASLQSSVIQLQNHGQIITGKNFKEVYQKALFFELACQIILSNNFNYQSLSPDQCSQLHGYR